MSDKICVVFRLSDYVWKVFAKMVPSDIFRHLQSKLVASHESRAYM